MRLIVVGADAGAGDGLARGVGRANIVGAVGVVLGWGADERALRRLR